MSLVSPNYFTMIFVAFFQEKLLAGGHTFSIDDAASNDDHYADGKMVKFLKMAVEPEKREIKRKKVDSSKSTIFSPFSLYH